MCVGVCCVQEVLLDFFGCAVKASEFSQHLAAMDLLAAQVNTLKSEQAGRLQPQSHMLPMAINTLSPSWHPPSSINALCS
jgi:hypothetical protein